MQQIDQVTLVAIGDPFELVGIHYFECRQSRPGRFPSQPMVKGPVTTDNTLERLGGSHSSSPPILPVLIPPRIILSNGDWSTFFANSITRFSYKKERYIFTKRYALFSLLRIIARWKAGIIVGNPDPAGGLARFLDLHLLAKNRLMEIATIWEALFSFGSPS
jgi:hypothetical protein